MPGLFVSVRKMEKLYFASDYQEGCVPEILAALQKTNYDKTVGYGLDPICERAKDKIRAACEAPEAEVWFLSGGTQTNATVIAGALRGYEAVIAAQTGHIQGHEAGAIELGGHKVLALPHKDGKLEAATLSAFLAAYFADENLPHTVQPRMVYLSQPTEYGTLYSRAELRAIAALCREYGLLLYADGARLAYALGCPENDLSLPELAALCDIFYLGGTKCGALLGEAVVAKKGLLPQFFTVIKQHGGLLAKGRVLGLQFDCLLEGGLYERLGRHANRLAARLRETLREKGYALTVPSPTNQVFVTMDDERLRVLGQRVVYSFWEKPDETHTVIRLATSWATTEDELAALEALL